MMKLLGNFVVKGDPSIDTETAGEDREGGATITKWPISTLEQPNLMVLNTTGGEVYKGPSSVPGGPNITQSRGPGLRNDFRVVNADEWEGGRGERCKFWRGVGRLVPE